MTLADSKQDIIELKDKEFRKISELVYRRFGINLTEKKKALVKGRLNSLIKSLGLNSFEEYYESVMNDATGKSLLCLIDRISTNHSYFFRETGHFDILKKSVLPEIFRDMEEQGRRDFSLWCAGCAGGEEPYNLAMVIEEFLSAEKGKWDIGILGTDISMDALKDAAMGVYPESKVGSIPPEYRKYFKKQDPDSYGVTDKIKQKVLFKRLNLMNNKYPFKGKFHIIFCRNVMIYFDRNTKMELAAKFHHYLHDGGYLFIGHSETLGRDPGIYRYIQPTVYQKC